MSNRSAQSAPLILLGAACLALPAPAQNPAPQQNVTVLVVNVVSQPQPVKDVRVSLQYLDTGAPITAARQVTNSQGHAPLVVSSDVAQRGRLRVQIDGATGLVIYLPADGQLPDYQPSVVPATVEIELLPKGSQKLLDEGQIEANLHRMLVQLNAQRSQNAAMKAQLAEAQNAKPDLGPAIAEWAATNGFSVDKVNQQVQAWANSIEDKSQATIEQKALAAIALKRYDEAEQLLNQLREADHKQIDAEDAEEQNLDAQVKALQAARQALLEKQRSSLRQLLDHSEQAAGADQLNLKYHDATQVLESAVATADAEYRKNLEDKGFHELWLEAVWDTASARWREGEVAPANEGLALLAQSASDFESLSRELDDIGDSRRAAAAQDRLGYTLEDEGDRTRVALAVTPLHHSGGEKAAAFFDQAAQAFQKELAVFTKANSPHDWATVQIAIGNLLVNESELANMEGQREEAMASSQKAVQTFRSALEVYTKADSPRDWAATQDGLGCALTEEARRAGGDQAAALLDQAVQAFQSALEVRNKTDLPLDWAATQNNLGYVLLEEAARASGDKAAALFAQAAEDFQKALEGFTKADRPLDWARTQNQLGDVLGEEAEKSGDANAPQLLEQAVQAYRSELQVYNKADFPDDWADAQESLRDALEKEGDALEKEAEQSSSDKTQGIFEQALQAYRDALRVDTRAASPDDWAEAQSDIGDALVKMGERVGRDGATALFDLAVQAYQNALQVYTKADSPDDWASTQNNLGLGLADERLGAGGDKAAALLDQAAQAYRSALEVYTKADSPDDWASTQNNLGLALTEEALDAGGDKAVALLDQAAQAYRSALEVNTRADSPQDWAADQNNLGSVLRFEGERASGDKAAALFEQAVECYESALQVEPGLEYSLVKAGSLYHERLFRFDRALEMDERWAKIDPSPIAKLSLAEAELTTNHFAECLQQEEPLADSALAPPVIVFRDVLKLACKWATGDKSATLSTDEALASKTPVLKAGYWDFSGTIHFLSNSPAFRKGRASWIALLTAIQNGDSAGMTAALHQLEPILQQ
jgi:tetratricopeptide (TPR) repeat protein